MKGMINVKKSSIVILSGACCNPTLRNIDVQVEKVLKEAANEMETEVTIKTVSIASAALGGFGGFGDKLGSAITTLLKEKGLGALPLIIIDGEIKYYATVPTFTEVCQQFK
jgi:hypothetical protein